MKVTQLYSQWREHLPTCSVETLESVKKAQFFCGFLWVPIFINENLKRIMK